MLKAHIRRGVLESAKNNLYIDVQSDEGGTLSLCQALIWRSYGNYDVRVDGKIIGSTENPAAYYLTFCEVNSYRLTETKAKYYESLVDWQSAI